MDDLDKFRFKNNCVYFGRKPQQILKSKVIPCMKKKYGKTCDFELMAVPPSADLDSGEIHIYAHSRHSNHSLKKSQKKPGIYRKGEMMPDANPPAVYPMGDIEWTFQGTFPDNGKLNKFRYEHECNHTTDRGCTRIRFYCRRRYTHDCKFMLMAMKTTKQRYHVYKHGEHSEHPARKSKRSNGRI